MTRPYPYTAILGWSASRWETFQACKRQYYYQYYAARHDREVDRARLEALKALTSLALEAGHVAHDAIAAFLRRLLRSDAPVDRGRFLEHADGLARQNAAARAFAEVHYGERPAAPVDELCARVALCAGNFLDSPRCAWIRERALATRRDWVIEPPGYGEARLDGMKVYCKVDFLFPVDGRLVILDWKTGKPDEFKHPKQLTGYAAWAACHYGTAPDRIEPVAAYLQPEYRETVTAVTQEGIARFAGQVRQETDAMQRYCADVAENTPKPKAEFPLTDNEFLCAYCNFREFCGRV